MPVSIIPGLLTFVKVAAESRNIKIVISKETKEKLEFLAGRANLSVDEFVTTLVNQEHDNYKEQYETELRGIENKLTVFAGDYDWQKLPIINLIREVRTITGWDLRTSKDAVDKLRHNNVNIVLEPRDELGESDVQSIKQRIKNYGFDVRGCAIRDIVELRLRYGL